MTTQPTTVAAELKTLQRIASLLETLDERARIRVLVWLGERYDTSLHGFERIGEEQT